MSEIDTQTATPPADPPVAPPPAEAASQDAAAPAAAEPSGDLLDTADAASAEGEPASDLLSVDEDAKQEGVPDSYTFDPPEGLDTEKIELNEEKLSSFMDLAKEQGLSQAQFQGIMSYYAERTQASVDEAVGQWNDRVDGWREATKTDKEIGGENLKSNLSNALGVVEKFGDPDLKSLIKSPSEDNPEGLAISNNPAFLRFLNRIGKVLGDPDLVQGDVQEQSGTNEARLKRMYPSMFPN